METGHYGLFLLCFSTHIFLFIVLAVSGSKFMNVLHTCNPGFEIIYFLIIFQVLKILNISINVLMLYTFKGI